MGVRRLSTTVCGTQTSDEVKVRVFVRYSQSDRRALYDDRSLQWADLYPLAGVIAVAVYILSECLWD